MFLLGPALAARTRATATLLSRRLAYSTARGSDKKSNRDKRRDVIDHAPGWREDLATASEASVKADRETTTIEEMQHKTVDYMRHSQGGPDVERTHASYAREEVSGPLGSAGVGVGVGEFEGVVGNDDLGPDHDDAQVESDGGRAVGGGTPRAGREKKKSRRKGQPGTG